MERTKTDGELWGEYVCQSVSQSINQIQKKKEEETDKQRQTQRERDLHGKTSREPRLMGSCVSVGQSKKKMKKK